MRTYPIICPSCIGSGTIINPDLNRSTSAVLTVNCPACGGNKWVMCNEQEAKS